MSQDSQFLISGQVCNEVESHNIEKEALERIHLNIDRENTEKLHVLKSLRRTLERPRNKKERLRVQNETLSDQNDALKTQVASFRTEYENLHLKNQEMTVAVLDLESVKTSLILETQELREHLEQKDQQLQQQAQYLQNAEEKVSSLKHENDKQSEINTVLKSTIKALKTEVKTLNSKLSQKEREMANQEETLNQKNQRVQRFVVIVKDLERQTDEFRAQTEVLQQDNKDLREKVTGINKQLADNNQALEQKDKQLQQQANDLQNAWETVRSFEQQSKMQTDFSNFLKSQNFALKAEVKQLNLKRTQNEEEITILEESLNQETQKVQGFLTSLKDLERQTDEFRAQAELLQQEKKDLCEKVTGINKQLADSKQALEQKDEQLQQQANDLQNAWETVRSFKQESKMQTELSDSLKSQNIALKTEVKQLNFKLSQNEERMAILVESVKQETQKVQWFLTSLKDLERQNDEFRAQTELLKQENEDLHKEVTEIRKKDSSINDKQNDQRDQEVQIVQGALREFPNPQYQQQQIQNFTVIADDLQESLCSVHLNQNMQEPQTDPLTPILQGVKQTFLRMYEEGTIRYWVPSRIFKVL